MRFLTAKNAEVFAKDAKGFSAVISHFSAISAVIFLLFFSSCKKELPDDYYNPKLSNLVVSLDTVQEFEDTLLITFDYEDMDGDLGFHDPNVKSLYVKDSRFQNADTYHVQPLAPEGSELKINGTLTVKLNGLFVVGNATTETLYFTVQITDRQSHLSNELVSKEIIVVR